MNQRRELPIRASEMGLLIYIVKRKEPVTPADAAGFFTVSKPMIAAMVKSLTEKGYIRKIPSDCDKRSFFLFPEEKAKEIVEETYEEYLKVVTLLQSKMGAEIFNEFISMMNTANEILEEEKRKRRAVKIF